MGGFDVNMDDPWNDPWMMFNGNQDWIQEMG